MKRYQRAALLLCAAAVFISSCAFLPRKDRLVLKEYEKPQYVVTHDVVIDLEAGIYLHKGDIVNLKVMTGTDWVKIWAYNTAVDPLRSAPVLILYMFSTDFENEKFLLAAFEKQLWTVVQKKGDAAPAPSAGTKGKR